ncbi:ABC transporter [Corynebacterium hadale]|uniref:ABC transporter n=1 Tax=Corynebacterium hadale TaxID=2026255 RepID=A0ABX4HBP1_9CORY|nr:ABC transporter family substrate-binding protein [Corynebacterium hadale]PAT06878.1 ABC transporter [Corynebacterium hadale]
MHVPARRWCAAFGAALLLAGSAGCAANPGPPPLVDPAEVQDAPGGDTSANDAGDSAAEPDEETSTSKPTQGPERTQITVGTDTLRNGLNPHLRADESAMVRSIANLVLPSAFVDGVRNDELLVAATRLPTSSYAMTVRYVIAPEAQWSDGTPITGADFAYLWRGMSHTPGAIDAEGYDAIVGVRVSGDGGKVVDVDFARPVGQWQSLFQHLLPAHLFAADASDFRAALHDTIPASAGRYMVREVDRGRGTVTLNRNDRFWGESPAQIDIINLQEVRTTTQVADQLRAGQLAFLDKTPQETSSRVLDLLPSTQTRLISTPRTLGVNVSVTSGLSRGMREELRSLIDVPLLAPISAGRSADLDPAEPTPPLEGEPVRLQQFVEKYRPLRIGVDASDTAASAAARSLADILNGHGVRASVVSTDTASLLSSSMPDGNVDVLVGWRYDAGTTTQLAGRVACPTGKYLEENVSGLCTQENQLLASAILSGEVGQGEAARRVADIEQQEVLWVPVVRERRILALGTTIDGPDADLQRWNQGLSSAAQWTLTGTE